MTQSPPIKVFETQDETVAFLAGVLFAIGQGNDNHEHGGRLIKAAVHSQRLGFEESWGLLAHARDALFPGGKPK